MIQGDEMDFDLSNLKIGEIVNLNKKNLLNRFFKLRIENKDYVLLISSIRASKMGIKVYTRTNTINEKNPIEHGIILYKQTFGIYNIDLESPDFWHLYNLNDFLENHIFTISELNNKTNEFIQSLIKNDEMTILNSSIRYYINLEKSDYKFEIALCNFIRENYLRKLNEDKDLEKEFTEFCEHKEKEKKEIAEHMDKVKEKERKKREFNEKLNKPHLKKSDDYNIRW